MGGREARVDAPRSRAASHVRLRAAEPAVDTSEAERVLTELRREHAALVSSFAAVEGSASVERPDDPASAAAYETFDARLADLRRVRETLSLLQSAASPRSLLRVFGPDRPLTDYVRGVYTWMNAIVQALGELAGGLRRAQADWATYRWRIEQARHLHLDELTGAVDEDLASLLDRADHLAVARLARAFEELAREARALEAALDERFG